METPFSASLRTSCVCKSEIISWAENKFMRVGAGAVFISLYRYHLTEIVTFPLPL